MTAETRGATAEPVAGVADFAARANQMLSGARVDFVLLTQELDRRIYGTALFGECLRRFALQHGRVRGRILVHSTQAAVTNSPRLVELARSLSSFIEFRELLPERRPAVREEYLITDGGELLYREAPGDLVARYYAAAPGTVRLKLKEFDTLWNESPPAQELRRLNL